MTTNCGCPGTMGYDPDCDEYATLAREGRVAQSRKPHHCCECGGLIPVGSRCCFATMLYDGSWDTMYRCLACATLAEMVATKLKFCPLWGCLSETCDEAEVNWHDWHARWNAPVGSGGPEAAP